MPGKHWDELFAVAMQQYGYVTSRDARRLGLRPSYLGELHKRGTVEPVARGLYRFPQIPVTELTPYMEAVLWVGQDAALSHDAVLSMHGLAQVNPRVLRVSTPRRVRKLDPPLPVEILRRKLPAEDLTTYEGIPSTTVARALRDCRGLVMQTRLLDAASEARALGLVRRRDLGALLSDLEHPDG